MDNWARSKITSHLGKRCVCGGCFNLDYKIFQLGPKSFVEDYTLLGGEEEYIKYIPHLKCGIIFKYSKTMLRHIQNPIYISRRLRNGFKRDSLKILGLSRVFNNNKMIFIICPECQRKILLQYKLSPILAK